MSDSFSHIITNLKMLILKKLTINSTDNSWHKYHNVMTPLREGTCMAIGTIDDPLFFFFYVAIIGFYVAKRTKE